MRSIRDELNDEIKDMSYEEQRRYLDKLLASKTTKKDKPQPGKKDD
jgi:hypothetical protein